LLDDEPVGVEAEKRRSGERLRRAVLRRHDRPPVDGCTPTVDERLAEATLGRGLVLECPRRVLRRALPVAERV
jgi:hypothetical protein